MSPSATDLVWIKEINRKAHKTKQNIYSWYDERSASNFTLKINNWLNYTVYSITTIC